VEALDVKDRIEEALLNAVAKENFKINVSVDGHSVTLSGNVNSYNESEIAKFAAWNTPGVVRVINPINYKLPP
jgi:osmotically-inducible protein OsmY